MDEDGGKRRRESEKGKDIEGPRTYAKASKLELVWCAQHQVAGSVDAASTVEFDCGLDGTRRVQGVDYSLRVLENWAGRRGWARRDGAGVEADNTTQLAQVLAGAQENDAEAGGC